MILDHHQAVLDLLAGLPVTLHDGQVPDRPTFPYAVLFGDTGNERSTRLCATSDRADWRFQVTSVGLTVESALIVADAARALLIDARPVVVGRSCGPIRRETSIPVRPDTDVTDPDTNRHPMFAVDTYHFVSYA
ncbi:hypothetical protein B1813_18995 [Saccharomonospora piscinae]|uniref:DUF3168 domain-containing protein n=1 Tax=Saccharomonospora piscinae TaxID=687388 RepID=A0A1V8ZYQ4_SACPI|nr:DUF3168 domain-containing protein [Saccharomonospora piscinae]OQO89928.1 hypothetical protein B1813_18995 [Saccharomonospora piscinae]